MKTSIVNYFNDTSYQDVIESVLAVADQQLNLAKTATLTVILADDAYIQQLNNTYRGKNQPTDVLTFPDGTMHHLGDVFISMETCKRQSEDYGHSMERELGFLVVHGLLHTLGYDHHTPEEESVMIPLQESILQAANLRR